MASDTTKDLSILNVDFHSPEELAHFDEQQATVFASRKSAIIRQLREDGYLDDQGNWHFKEDVPADMLPDSKADFHH